MSMITGAVEVRRTGPGDVDEMIAMCRVVYPTSAPWSREQLLSHQRVFPEGQLVAVDCATQSVLGFAASLVILWDDYEMDSTWRDFTDHGFFTNHDPHRGRTLYGAEVMVHPEAQGSGIGKKLYQARRELAQSMKLLRIRAGARLRGYHRYADKMTPEEYVLGVIRGEIGDPTLSFQLKQGFHVLAVVSGYLRNDPESLGYAAVIEWLNPEIATPQDSAAWPKKYRSQVTS